MKRVFGRPMPSAHVMVTVAVLAVVVTAPAWPCDQDITTDDLRLFHRGWTTWIGLGDEYDRFGENLPEPVNRREYTLGAVPIDSMIDLEFEYTMITIYFVTDTVWRLTTRSPEMITPRGIVVGTGRDRVRGAYGEPWRTVDSEGRDVYQYRTRSSTDPFFWSWWVLTFYFDKRNRVSGMELSGLSSRVP